MKFALICILSIIMQIAALVITYQNLEDRKIALCNGLQWIMRLGLCVSVHVQVTSDFKSIKANFSAEMYGRCGDNH